MYHKLTYMITLKTRKLRYPVGQWDLFQRAALIIMSYRSAHTLTVDHRLKNRKDLIKFRNNSLFPLHNWFADEINKPNSRGLRERCRQTADD